MKGSLVLISLALVRFIHRARTRVPIYAFTRMHTGTHTQPTLVRASPDDPVHVLLPNPFSAEPGATGGPGLASTHVLRLGPRDSCYFSKSNLLLRTKIRLLGEYKRMIRSPDGCSQRGAAAGLGGGCALALGQCPVACRCSLGDGRPRCPYRSLTL